MPLTNVVFNHSTELFFDFKNTGYKVFPLDENKTYITNEKSISTKLTAYYKKGTVKVPFYRISYKLFHIN